ncbi:histidine phosphatase family protein [Allobaculum sp. JKK-2023]|uniref:histidine phosphatase family protein n=1 Tax=Allobaculum sp. JKK-2023 TaxID=3108943 RepID=UPI002B057B0E|nr:histidine phosphatase family protein [Allobaculum sp. JKK-2023]
MSVRLFVVRHGQTVMNQEKRSQGWLDSPLTERGKVEALIVRNWLKDRHLQFAHGYSSDLGRARQTLGLLVQGEFPTNEEAGLREMTLGKMDGVQGFVLDPAKWNQQAKEYGGESFEHAAGRAIASLYAIARVNSGQNVLVVTHGMVINLLMETLPPIQAVWKDTDRLENGMILELVYTCGQLWLSGVHLPVSEYLEKHNLEEEKQKIGKF